LANYIFLYPRDFFNYSLISINSLKTCPVLACSGIVINERAEQGKELVGDTQVITRVRNGETDVFSEIVVHYQKPNGL
jgi:hypothetical protein